MPKQGSEFENLTAEIFNALRNDTRYESVEKNVMINGIDGPREVDVLLRGKVGPIDIVTAIECKDYNKVVNVTTLDAFESKLKDIKANKGILVARKGFSKGARKKATRLGITLCTVHQARSDKWNFNLEIPFLIIELEIDFIKPKFLIPAGNWFVEELDIWHINDKPLHQIIGEYWNNNDKLNFEGVHSFNPIEDGPAYIKKRDGTRIQLHKTEVDIHIRNAFYLGYFNELDSAKLLRYIEEDNCSVIFDLRELVDYRAKAPKFKNKSDLPPIPGAIEFTSKLIINPGTPMTASPSVRKFLPIA
ncbi:restriction endonuclease [Amphritea sp.]|uniref:restriction endonuclease n=1 Tax=Amphritea sp. TaxID=1872502 RepID=UPI003D0C325E